LTRSRKHSCHGNGTVPSSFIVVGVDVTVKNIIDFSVAKVRQHWGLLALLSNYKLFRTAVYNNKDYTSSACLCIPVLVIPHVNPIFLRHIIL